MEEKYIATMVLHALGDTIGFKNGEWEFNYFQKQSIITLNTTLEILYEFIDLGGINEINLENWRVSDDTILHMAVADSILEINNFDTDENKYEIFKKHYLLARTKMAKDFQEGRDPFVGNTTYKSLDALEQGKDWKKFPYNPNAGGSGASMRTACLGLAFYGTENRQKLIDLAIQSSKMTHTSPIGYLGGLATALFIAFAFEKVDLYQWPYLLLDILNSENVQKYIDMKNEDAVFDYYTFMKNWQRYIDTRFMNGKPIKTRSQTNLISRSKYHFENFAKEDKKNVLIGESGYSSVIMAYDSLIDAGNNWEKLVIYAMLHFGDSDTVGSIAGAFYGALYGFGDVPEKNMKYLEYKERLIEIGKNIYKKFFLHEDLRLLSRIQQIKKL